MSHAAAPSLVQYWHDAKVPSEVSASIATFAAHNRGMPHVVFNERTADEFIAERFGARHLEAFRACAVPAMQADYLRYCALLSFGGVYVDVRFRCLRPLDALIETASDGLLFANGPPGVLINGFFLFKRPDHPFLQLALEVATANIEQRTPAAVNLVTGPWIFTGLSELYRAGSFEVARQRASGEKIEPLAETMLEVVGSYRRVATAFEGVRIEPLERASEWIERPTSLPAYKQTDSDWINWSRGGGTIFR